MGISAFREQIGSEKEVLAMSRMPKYLKEELAFFLDERGRKKYNELCRKCERSCKQSFVNLPFERGKILFSKGFFVYTDIRKLTR